MCGHLSGQKWKQNATERAGDVQGPPQAQRKKSISFTHFLIQYSSNVYWVLIRH